MRVYTATIDVCLKLTEKEIEENKDFFRQLFADVSNPTEDELRQYFRYKLTSKGHARDVWEGAICAIHRTQTPEPYERKTEDAIINVERLVGFERLWSRREMRAIPVGARIRHSKLGHGTVNIAKTMGKYVEWDFVVYSSSYFTNPHHWKEPFTLVAVRQPSLFPDKL